MTSSRDLLLNFHRNSSGYVYRPFDGYITRVFLLLKRSAFGSVLSKPRFSLQVPEQFAASLEIGDQIEIGVGLETKLEADEEG